jgi:hypothetical protein
VMGRFSRQKIYLRGKTIEEGGGGDRRWGWHGPPCNDDATWRGHAIIMPMSSHDDTLCNHYTPCHLSTKHANSHAHTRTRAHAFVIGDLARPCHKAQEARSVVAHRWTAVAGRSPLVRPARCLAGHSRRRSSVRSQARRRASIASKRLDCANPNI